MPDMAELRLFGRSAAPGVAEGVVAVLDAAKRSRRVAGTRSEEALALRLAISQALAEVVDLAENASGEAADMLGFQVAMLSDDELARPALEAVEAGDSAAAAWEAAMAPKSPATAPPKTSTSPPVRRISKTSAIGCSAI